MIVLPSLFAEKLSDSPELESMVKQTFTSFEPWLRDSGMPFFPGFTDHSPLHINDVLSTAASLIADDAHSQISAADVAVLCMAILLHDCGMHLTPDLFRRLVSSSDQPRVDGFDDQPWNIIWADFLSEASRFGQEKLNAIFGDVEPVDISAFDMRNLTERDHLLIGEFVRRHHTRLAHEIAIAGIGVSDGMTIALTGFDLEFRDIAGLIARSHGMDIRDTFPYIKKKFGLIPSFRDVKIPYLMAILRIADYIQVQSERAIKALLNVKELRSPLSRQEWMAHFAVRDVSTDHEDPEALYVHAMPKDVKGFLKLSALFKDIQKELDVSWGTLGEVYGRHRTYRKLGLTIRRIRSNLDNVQEFSCNVSYIPIRAHFDASGPDLLRLLVGPLYDYNYDVGIRELVQNAVDACRELMDITTIDGKVFDSDNVPVVKVEISESSEGGGVVRIIDTGVGMTLDTVTKYFLIAGASFRNSDMWKKQHLDESGNVRVLRGGRFGVGALAAFLLGQEINVKTRHFTSGEGDGIEFVAHIDDTAVELRRCNAPIGTTIEVKISDPAVIDALRPSLSDEEMRKSGDNKVLQYWASVDWFAQQMPPVEYSWDGFQRGSEIEDRKLDHKRYQGTYRRDSKKMVPSGNRDLSEFPEWRFLGESSPYAAIAWKLGRRLRPDIGSSYWSSPRSEIYVNGIFVEIVDHDGLPLRNNDAKNGGQLRYVINRPTLAIFDPAGICPINLQRSAVAFDRMGVDDKIAEAVLYHHFSSWRSTVGEVANVKGFFQACRETTTSELVSYFGQLYPIAATAEGMFLAHPEFFKENKINTIYFFDEFECGLNLEFSKFLRDGEAFMIRRKSGSDGIQKRLEWFRGVFDIGVPRTHSFSYSAGLPQIKSSFAYDFVGDADWTLINDGRRVRRDLLDSITAIDKADGNFLLSMAHKYNGDGINIRAGDIAAKIGATGRWSAWGFENIEINPGQSSQIREVWTSLFGTNIRFSENRSRRRN